MSAVQPAHGKDPRAPGEGGRAPPRRPARIGAGRHVAARLVQEQVGERLRRRQAPAVHRDARRARDRPARPARGATVAVDGDAPSARTVSAPRRELSPAWARILLSRIGGTGQHPWRARLPGRFGGGRLGQRAARRRACGRSARSRSPKATRNSRGGLVEEGSPRRVLAAGDADEPALEADCRAPHPSSRRAPRPPPAATPAGGTR